jgi:hypothetical protein
MLSLRPLPGIYRAPASQLVQSKNAARTGPRQRGVLTWAFLPSSAPAGNGASPNLQQRQQPSTVVGITEGAWDHFTSLAAFVTAFFPVWVLGGAGLGWARPAAFAWFDASFATSALSTTMFFMGLSLTLEVCLA